MQLVLSGIDAVDGVLLARGSEIRMQFHHQSLRCDRLRAVYLDLVVTLRVSPDRAGAKLAAKEISQARTLDVSRGLNPKYGLFFLRNDVNSCKRSAPIHLAR